MLYSSIVFTDDKTSSLRGPWACSQQSGNLYYLRKKMEIVSHLMNETPNEINWGLACWNSARSCSNTVQQSPSRCFVFSLFIFRGLMLWFNPSLSLDWRIVNITIFKLFFDCSMIQVSVIKRDSRTSVRFKPNTIGIDVNSMTPVFGWLKFYSIKYI